MVGEGKGRKVVKSSGKIYLGWERSGSRTSKRRNSCSLPSTPVPPTKNLQPEPKCDSEETFLANFQIKIITIDLIDEFYIKFSSENSVKVAKERLFLHNFKECIEFLCENISVNNRKCKKFI